MKKKSSVTGFVVGFLVLGAIAVFQVGAPAPQAKNSSPAVGMGDVHRVESIQSNPDTGGRENSRPYTGMGDWKLFEERQESTQTHLRMSDLDNFLRER